ncbi:MAG TPA: type IX secretion system sortase PorU, partial [Bacteroidia bacterium]|nr:type IX secretion system sortase PorU [Bacteroidia bacterium]
MVIKKTEIVINLVLTLLFCSGYAQNMRLANTQLVSADLLKINWKKPVGFQNQGKVHTVLAFDNVSYFSEKNYLPYLYLSTPCLSGTKLVPVIEVAETAFLTSEEENCVNKIYLSSDFEINETTVLIAGKIPHAYAKLIPLRINKQNGKIEKLISYNLQWKTSNEIISVNQKNASVSFASSSVLATDKWYKIGTTDNAVYKIDKTFLQNLGINVSTIDPRNIKIYGNGGEMLSEFNGDFHYDDLNENSIFVQGESDGIFDNTDYILFYGQSPNKWKYNPGKYACTRYSRSKHFYADTVFYFLTVDNTPGKRIQQQASSVQVPTYTVGGFDDCQAHESDAVNLVKSGRELYGENFDNTTQYSFNFNFPAIQNDTVWIKTSLLGRRVDPGTGVPPGAYDISCYSGANLLNTYQVSFPVTCSDFDCDVGKDLSGCASKSFIYGGGTGAISVTVNRTYTDESGWLNYIWIMARRALTMVGNQMAFRDFRSIGSGVVSQFNIASNAPNLKIWNVTDGINVNEQQSNFSAGIYSFSAATDSLLQFIAFDGNNFKIPTYSKQIANQNLHALQPVDYILVTHPWFLNQAQQLADLHSQKEKYSYVIVTPDQIYNEFSSGMQDITAIRLFVRMLYKRANPGNEPKHLLLYGDGSYLLKDVNPQTNTNFIPTFQTVNSSSYMSSKCSDDFYGFLDDNEGQIDCCGNPDGLLDIGIGRLPTHSISEADAVLNKIVAYYARKIPTSSCCDGVSANAEDWRNWVCLIADDANPGSVWETTFVSQTESFASLIGANKRYNIDKI